jgi:Domain of unknown function (DUF222)
MCVFDRKAGEEKNSDKRGAAPWAGVSVPVIRPENWSVYELRVGMRELERVRRETEAAMALLVGAVPESRDTIADIARSTGISNKEAKRRKRVADVVGKVKGALEKLAGGSVSDEHIGALAPVADMPGADSLLDDAASTTPEEFANAVEQFRLAASCGEDMAKRQRARRALRFYAGSDGMIGLSGLLPPMEGTELKNRLAAIVDARWRADHPERAATLGGHGGDTYEQRMADALLAMAGVVTGRAGNKSDSSNSSDSCDSNSTGSAGEGRSSDCVPSTGSATDEGNPDRYFSTGTEVVRLRSNDSGFEFSHKSNFEAVGSDELFENGQAPPSVTSAPDPPAAQFTQVKTGKPAVVIIFDVDKWEARIAGGGPIPITELLLDQARNDLYYCFKNSAGEVLKFGRSRRDPTPVQRLALVVRDERCLYPGCHAPPDRCDVHHTNEVVKDQGCTDVEVMGLFCKSHHRHIHVNDLVVIRELGGSVTIKNRRTGAIEAQTPKRGENLRRAA